MAFAKTVLPLTFIWSMNTLMPLRNVCHIVDKGKMIPGNLKRGVLEGEDRYRNEDLHSVIREVSMPASNESGF